MEKKQQTKEMSQQDKDTFTSLGLAIGVTILFMIFSPRLDLLVIVINFYSWHSLLVVVLMFIGFSSGFQNFRAKNNQAYNKRE